MWALRRRAHNQIDQWDGTHYTRVLLFDHMPVKVCVSQLHTEHHPELLVNLSSAKPIEQLSSRVREILQRMLGLSIDVSAFYQLIQKDEPLCAFSQRFLGVKPPRFPSLFEALLNAFACQQVTLHVGLLLLNRLTATYGVKFDDGQTVSSAFPEPEEIAAASVESIRALGFSYQKARAITELATTLVYGKSDFSLFEGMSNEEVRLYLSPMRGVGRWTAEYVLLRGLGRLETFPGDDVGAQNNLQNLLRLAEKPTYAKIQTITSSWQPFAGFVYFHFLLDTLQKNSVIH